MIVDLFAGGGGASLAIQRAFGRSPDLAVDHDEHAIRMHAANHPETHHEEASVWEVRPREACGGREGLDIIAQGPPDLVLLDLAMPEVSGYDVLNAIRATSSPHPVRVILMSGVALGEGSAPRAPYPVSMRCLTSTRSSASVISQPL